MRYLWGSAILLWRSQARTLFHFWKSGMTIDVIQEITESKKIDEDLEQRITKLISLSVELEQCVNHWITLWGMREEPLKRSYGLSELRHH
jgi:hypothetical protein